MFFFRIHAANGKAQKKCPSKYGRHQPRPCTVFHREQNDEASFVLRNGEQKRSQPSSIYDRY